MAEVRSALTQAKQKTVEVADKATNAAATGAIVAFIALLLGAITASFGGHRGTRFEESEALHL